MVQSGSKAAPIIYYNGYKLGNRDYTLKSKSGNLKFSDADDVSNRKLTIEGKGNFSGSIKDADVTVLSKQEMKERTINVSLGKNIALTYNGKPQTLTEGTQLIVMAAGKTLSANYIVSYTSNKNAGTAKVTVSGINGYTGTATKTFKIAPDTKSSMTPSIAAGDILYDISGAKPTVTVRAARDGVTRALEEGVDYKVSYSGNKAVTKNAKYNVTFIGNYKGQKKITKTFEIKPAEFSEKTVSLKASDLVYGKPGKYLSEPYVSIGGVLLAKKDYTVKYYIGTTDITTNSKYALTGDSASVSIVLKGKGNYAGNEVRFENCYTIRKAPDNAIDLSKIKVTMKGNIKKGIPTQQYTGLAIEPEYDIYVKVGNEWKKASDAGLAEGTDYEVTFINNVNKGNAVILVTSKSTSSKAIKGKAVKFKIGARGFSALKQVIR